MSMVAESVVPLYEVGVTEKRYHAVGSIRREGERGLMISCGDKRQVRGSIN